MLTCGIWVKKGIAKEEPDKIALTEEDLKQILEDTKDKIKDVDEEVSDTELEEEQRKYMGGIENEEDDMEEQDVVDEKEVDVKREDNESETDEAIRAEYGLDNYDEEGALMTGAGMAGLMYFASTKDDPYVDMKDVDEEDREDFIIKKEDNLFVVGKMEEDFSCLEVYVFNDDEDSLYVHHDVLLESFPLCLEWLSYDPSLQGKSGNYVAVGTMEPDIQVWDLDVVDTVEPAFILAGKKKKKKKKKQDENPAGGHSDAVLGISWNPNVKNVLASGSADTTVVLWDMSKCACVHTLKHHSDKVQSVRWHPYEVQSLLTGAFDKTAVVLDCRSPEVFKSWSLTGECEQVMWDHFSPYNFFVSSDDGVVCYCDVRTDTPVYTLHAHNEAVTGMSLSAEIPGCLTTVSSDKMFKVWDCRDDKPQCVLTRDVKMGGMNFVTSCPDVPLTFAMGGQKDGVRVLNLLETTAGKQHFQNRERVKSENTRSEETYPKASESNVTMDTAENATEALATLSLQIDNKSNCEIIKKKKKKKKKK